MALASGSLVEITAVGLALDQQAMNVFQYEIGSFVINTTAPQIGEAWWNHVKTTLRGLFPTTASSYFRSVLVRELNDPAGDYGEYAVPMGERAGTRSVGGADSPLPAFAAVGMRLMVATRATRPGQKRFAAVTENDNDYGSLTSGIVTAANALGAVLVTSMVLGAPTATTTLNPIVCRKDVAGAVIASQPVTGFLVNPYVTSQVSRKPGRGI